jgi:hypothetical protein
MRYEFRVTGLVSEPLAEAFPELDHVTAQQRTIFFGPVTDDAHLYSLLVRLQSLGQRVEEMRQLPD